MNIQRRITAAGWGSVILLMGLMFILALTSMVGDALTFDELAHITAGYTYLTAQDNRINPEHPPLIKDLAALTLLGLNLNFPYESQNWKMDAGPPPWWVQFDLGREFLYQTGNDPQSIIFWSRVPMLAMLVGLGLFLYWWARKIGGRIMGLGVAILYAFSPTFLAHGRLVTTDIGVVLGAAVAIYAWVNFLQRPISFWRLLGAAAGFALAMLLKFSLVLLIPTFAILAVMAAIVKSPKQRWRRVGRYAALSLLAGVLAICLIIAPVYQWHIKNYPTERQVRDTIGDLQADGLTFYEQALAVYGADKPLLRAPAQFFRGVLMAAQRVQFGNTVYFLGQVKGTAFWYYFPLIILFKLPPGVLALFALGAVGIGRSIWRQVRDRGWREGASEWIRENFALTGIMTFVAIYWLVALVGNLNIGVRHLLPTIPLGYILAMWGIKDWLAVRGQAGSKRLLKIIIGGAFGWYVVSGLNAWPHYLSYYNFLAGGTENGYKVAVDSNYDWGQDFGRLVDFIDENQIQEIHLDYFGGENPEYYLGERVVRFNPRESAGPPQGWLAVSVNQLMGGVGQPVFEEGLALEHGYYAWLADEVPVAKAGKSIFIYNFN